VEFTLLQLFSLLALGALWFASWGGFHQALTNAKSGNTNAITPERFEGVCIANTLWVLYACSLPETNLPLALGCGAWVIAGGTNLIQTLRLPPTRPAVVQARTIGVLALSAAGLFVAILARENVQAFRYTLEWVSVGSTILFVHSGQILQMLHTKRRDTLDGVSRWDVIAPFVDWSVFIVYSILLGPLTYWPIMLNSVLGFFTSGARLYQYVRRSRRR
jgi:uncharacterized protein with PQ loop repeat